MFGHGFVLAHAADARDKDEIQGSFPFDKLRVRMTT
jgi:hypothetical protein